MRKSGNIGCEYAVANFGGAKLVSIILRDILRPQFKRGRYSLGRQAQPIPDPERGPSIPFGYLLNVAVKHINHQDSPLSDRALFDTIIKQSGDIVAILDLEAYSSFETLFPSHEDLPNYIQNAVLGDFSLSFRQLRVSDALIMIEHLFGWVNLNEMKHKLGWTIEDALNLAKAVLTATPPEEVNIVFSKSDLVSRSGCPPQVLDRMLPCFTLDSREVNQGFLRPFDAAAVNLYSKPFIWKNGDRRILVSPTIGALAFYEAIAAVLRNVHADADKEIGSSAEKLLSKAFQSHGIEPSAVSKKYHLGTKIYECDLVIEHPDALLLFEIKKKPLTTLAMAGNILVAIKDLVLSMINSQLQLSRHETQLIKKGKISFLDGTEILLNGRRIERLAITLLDWGSSQDKLISDNILKTLATSSVGTTEPSSDNLRILDSISSELQKFQRQHLLLSELKEPSAMPFFDCYFFGIPLILYLLDGVQTIDDFYHKLQVQKNIVTGASDPYGTDSRFATGPTKRLLGHVCKFHF